MRKLILIILLFPLLTAAGCETTGKEYAEECKVLWHSGENTSVSSMPATFMTSCCDALASNSDAKAAICAKTLLLEKHTLMEQGTQQSTIECISYEENE